MDELCAEFAAQRLWCSEENYRLLVNDRQMSMKMISGSSTATNQQDHIRRIARRYSGYLSFSVFDSEHAHIHDLIVQWMNADSSETLIKLASSVFIDSTIIDHISP